MKQTILLSSVGLMAVVLLQPMTMHAQTSSEDAQIASMLEMIQQLSAQVEELQKMIAAQRSQIKEIREEIKAGLQEGMRDEDVRKLQELLASDPEIYPEALLTGYYGTLTKQALSRLQQRHQLAATGELDEATRDLINQYFAERKDRTAPEGLLRAPGIVQAVERGVCDRGRGNRPFCPEVSKDEEQNQSGRPNWAGRPDADDDDEKDESEEELRNKCGLSVFEELIGSEVDRDEAVALWEEYHDTDATNRSVRILEPGDATTMDYVETRVNIFLDDEGEVEKVTCG